MARKIGFWAVWVGFIGYVLLLAPPFQPDIARLQNFLAGNWADINPWVIAIFSMIGMWIMIYCGVIFADGRGQRIPAWAFVLASIGSGVIGLIPYLALREPNPTFEGRKDKWLRFWDSRWTGLAIAFSTLFFLAFGLLFGNWADFVSEFQTSRFIHAMTLAFCLFGLLFPALLGDDMARRGLKESWVFWAVALVPLLGPLAYFCARPQLPATVYTEVPSAP
ncbi:DUF2834 domain-containing protein [Oscillatoria sp. FACHB-1407]|uniref:DUF2834 domain-containing protein n=1 Tax=Oscillatoria sp. FACHB-1407 TaxID=2692847 RepID=UPI001682D5FA|nr:DUF2834 domain-containing protein [Oscillatoria sp. FACHB-1407]MBD2462575.1 DUF2834 domain-containing protein [Oscillatoria sp. FACHB-1407]